MQEIAIKSWLAGKTIFVTGATGFLGKVLIEKVLRDCENVSRLYVLIRAQNEFDLSNRFSVFKENIIFNRIKETNPKLMDKLQPVRGDLAELSLGLSENNRNRLMSEVNVILHSGASVKFEEPIEDAVKMNVRGTREMLTLAKGMPNLQSFVYVSTAYSNCNLNHIEEKVYPMAFDSQHAIELCEQGQAKAIETTVLRAFPNTYIFSKNLAEQLVFNSRNDLPLCIVRPSIISPSCSDPYPGWVDSNNGPMGFLIGAGSGFVRTGHGNRFCLIDLLPVDYAANGIIAAAVNIGQNKVVQCPVYNLTTGGDIPISCHQLIESHLEIILENPFSKMLWYPGGNLYTNFYVYLITFVLFQLIPAVFCDILLYIVKRRTWFVSQQLKTYNKLRLFSFFMKRGWRWETDNTKALHQRLKLEERHTFNFRIHYMDLRKYFRNWHYGTRKYLLNIEEKATKADKRNFKILYYLDLAVKTIFWAYIINWGLVWLGYGHISPIVHLGKCESCSVVKNEFQKMMLKK